MSNKSVFQKQFIAYMQKSAKADDDKMSATQKVVLGGAGLGSGLAGLVAAGNHSRISEIAREANNPNPSLLYERVHQPFKDAKDAQWKIINDATSPVAEKRKALQAVDDITRKHNALFENPEAYAAAEDAAKNSLKWSPERFAKAVKPFKSARDVASLLVVLGLLTDAGILVHRASKDKKKRRFIG